MEETLKIGKKVVLLGDPAVGKTSLIRKFVMDFFDDKYLETLGTKVTNKVLKFQDPEKKMHIELRMSIWDIMGQESYRLIQKSAFRAASGAILVADLTRKETLDNLDNWISELFNITGVIPVIFVGNKKDLIENVSEKNENLEHLSKSYLTVFYLTSAKTGENVDDAFETLGQMLLNTTS